MENIPFNPDQKRILLDAINYNPDEDFRGDRGLSLANLLETSFDGVAPKIMGLTEKKIEFYEIINSKDIRVLYSRMRKRDFKGIFGKLKKSGYTGADGNGMKNYLNMTPVEMLNYYMQLRKELNIFR